MTLKKKLILIGASTGGPGHIKKIFSSYESYFCAPIVIAQHMNQQFISSFVRQFDDEHPFDILLANFRHKIDNSCVYICADHCEFAKKDFDLYLEKADDVMSHYSPSIDHLFLSAVKLCKDYDILAILLTGIGQDGAQGLSELKDTGATCIAESKESAIVYGMPKKAAELNSNIKVMHLDEIIKYMKKFGG